MLPSSHGLRVSIERHKGRLAAEFTRARIRRGVSSVNALKESIDAQSQSGYPRWIRINTLVTRLEDQLDSTFAEFEQTLSIKDVAASNGAKKLLFIDPHVPNLVACSPGTDFIKTDAYTNGAIILQDKASCFPAYLLDPRLDDGDFIDACAAPGNKTTHLAAILYQHHLYEPMHFSQKIYACEKNSARTMTLKSMIKKARATNICKVQANQDFLSLDPEDERFKHVGALLLDPSCSGSGIVGRDEMPNIHLPKDPAVGKITKLSKPESRKRKRFQQEEERKGMTIVNDDGNVVVVDSDQELRERLQALAAFQLSILLHSFKFPAATKVSYSTCSIHIEENEDVVMKALRSPIARERGWRILKRDKQVRGMREWPVRGRLEACNGEEDVSQALIRTYKDDGRGVMGFFVAGFVRDRLTKQGEGPFIRNEEGMIIRDPSTGMPVLKKTGNPVPMPSEVHIVAPPSSGTDELVDEEGNDCPYVKDDEGMILRDDEGMPFLRRKGGKLDVDIPEVHYAERNKPEESDEEWEGFDD